MGGVIVQESDAASQLQGLWLDLELMLLSVHVLLMYMWVSFNSSKNLLPDKLAVLNCLRCKHVCALCSLMVQSPIWVEIFHLVPSVAKIGSTLTLTCIKRLLNINE